MKNCSQRRIIIQKGAKNTVMKTLSSRVWKCKGVFRRYLRSGVKTDKRHEKAKTMLARSHTNYGLQ